MAFPLLLALGRILGPTALRAAGSRLLGSAAARSAATRAAAGPGTAATTEAGGAAAAQQSGGLTSLIRSLLQRRPASPPTPPQVIVRSAEAPPLQPPLPKAPSRLDSIDDFRAQFAHMQARIDRMRATAAKPAAPNPQRPAAASIPPLQPPLPPGPPSGNATAGSDPSDSIRRAMSSWMRGKSQQPLPPASQFPGLSASQKLGMMGRSGDEVEEANRREQESQRVAAAEEAVAEEADNLKEKLKGLVIGVGKFAGGVQAAMAIVSIPMSIRRLGQAMVESRRGDSHFSGQVAGAFARYDIARLQIQRQSATSTAGSTRGAIDSQIALEEQMADMNEDLKTIRNNATIAMNKIAEVVHQMAYSQRIGLKNLARVSDWITRGKGDEDKKKQSEKDFTLFRKILGEATKPAFKEPGRIRPLEPVK